MDIVKVDRDLLNTIKTAQRSIMNMNIDDSLTADNVVGALSSAMIISAGSSYTKYNRMSDDEFLRNESLVDFVSTFNMNMKSIAAEVDAINANLEVLSSIATGNIEELKASLSRAEDAINTLLVYHESLGISKNVIMVVPKDLSGDLSTYGVSIYGKMKSSTNSDIRLESIQTNGLTGDLLELDYYTVQNIDLDIDKISFYDKDGTYSKKENMIDRNELSIFEVESYEKTNTTSMATYIPPKLESSLPTESFFKMKDRFNNVISWEMGPENKKLYADITLRCANGTITELMISIADKMQNSGTAVPHPFLGDVLVSKDMVHWTKVSAISSLAKTKSGSDMRIIINNTGATFVKLRLEQTIPYITNVINCAFWKDDATAENGGYWMNPADSPAFTYGQTNKAAYFSPSQINSSLSTKIRKHIFALPMARYCIAIKEISGSKVTYNNSSVFETKEYAFEKGLDRVGLDVDEAIPEGTDVQYEVTHNNGKTWTKIAPVKRSGSGSEIVAFSQGGSLNPNISSVSYVEVDTPPKTIKLKVTISSQANITPVIKNIKIIPIFKG